MSSRKIQRCQHVSIFFLLALLFVRSIFRRFATIIALRHTIMCSAAEPGQVFRKVLSGFALSRPDTQTLLRLFTVLISHVSIARSFGDELAGAAREGARETRRRCRRLALDASRFLTSGGAVVNALPVIHPQMRDQIFFREKLASAVVFRAREHRARFSVRFEMRLEIARVDGLSARGASFLPLGPSGAVALLEVAPGFETRLEDGFALGMKL